MKIKWFKMRPEAQIPYKSHETDAGLDIYTVDENIVMPPFSQFLFATGLSVVCEPGWWLLVKDRGSTGSKGLHVHCGVIDSEYRGEVFICIKNTNPYEVRFTNNGKAGEHRHSQYYDQADADGRYTKKEVSILDYVVYPTSKAIAQIIPIQQPVVESIEMTSEEWDAACDTERGAGKLGSSGK